MEEESITKYKAFDFIHNKDWQEYLNHIYPIPTGSTLEHYKRKWYKRMVNPEFDIDANIQPRQNAPVQRTTSLPSSPVSELFYGIVYLVFLSMALAGQGFKFAFAAHFVGIVRDFGLPRLSRAWWGQTLVDENLQSLFFVIVYTMLHHVAFWLVPEGIMFLLEMTKLLQVYGFGPVKNIANKVEKNKESILEMKASYELLCGVGSIFLIFTGHLPVLIPLLYWQFLRVKWTVSNHTKKSFSDAKQFGDMVADKVFIFSWPWQKLSDFIESMGRVDRDRPAFCQIM